MHLSLYYFIVILVIFLWCIFEAFGPRCEVGFVILYMDDLGQREKLISNQVIQFRWPSFTNSWEKNLVLKHSERGSMQSLC